MMMIKGSNSSQPTKPYVWRRHTFAGSRWTRNRLVRSLLMVVPWIDLMAVAVFLGFILHGTLVQPGRLIDLPKAQPTEGMLAQAPTAIVRRLIAPNRPDVSILIMDDVRYTSDRPVELETLRNTSISGSLNLLMDERLSYGEALAWMERLRECGAQTINLVVKPTATETQQHVKKP